MIVYFRFVNKLCLEHFTPPQHFSVDKSMLPYFAWHGAKQYIHGKLIKFGYKLWVMATLLGYCIQFRPYASKNGSLNEYMNVGLGLGGAVVASLTQVLPKIAN